MPREFRLPELAESVVEGEIVRWLVAEGETVTEDQPIIEVMTDKVTVELPSPYSGVLEKRLVAEGDVVEVHRPIALFSDEAKLGGDATGGAASEGAVAKRTAGTAEGAPVKVPDEGAAESATERPSEGVPAATGDGEDQGDRLSLFRPSKEVDEGPLVQVRRPGTQRPAAKGPFGRVLAVPAARRLARELGVEIERVSGSGPNGRVRVDDVSAHAAGAKPGGGAPADAGPSAVVRREPAAYVTPVGYEGLEERIPVRGLRRAISQQMVASHLQSVRTLHVDEADVSALVDMRTRLKGIAEKRGVKLSYLPFIMKAVVAALKAVPVINSSLDEATGEIVRKSYYNLGLAVATDNGLVVPVIHDVDSKSILELAEELQAKAQRARDGKLTSEDVRGGTFSITNIGTIGGLFSFPIINVPEAAILGVHSIKKRPVVLADDSIVARQMLYLSLSFDHRIIDGAEGATFTSRLIELLETPDGLLLDL
jgi:2-oxoisovalerate dehydrogenase E2 component (dihydrolipoyl transacylase)